METHVIQILNFCIWYMWWWPSHLWNRIAVFSIELVVWNFRMSQTLSLTLCWRITVELKQFLKSLKTHTHKSKTKQNTLWRVRSNSVVRIKSIKILLNTVWFYCPPNSTFNSGVSCGDPRVPPLSTEVGIMGFHGGLFKLVLRKGKEIEKEAQSFIP